MRNRKGFLSAGVLLLALALAPLRLWASPGRLAALGLANGTSWMLGTDEGYFFINPAAIQILRPQVWGDLTQTDAGLLLAVGRDFNLYFVTGLPATTAGFGGPIPGSPITPIAHELLRAGAGFNVGKINVGVSAFGTGASYSNATNNDQDLMVGLNGGVIFPLSSSLSLDAALGATYWNIQRHLIPAGAAEYSATPFDFSLSARLNMALAQANTLRIFGQYGLLNRGYTLSGATTAASTSIITGGASDEMSLGGSVTIFAGAYVNANLVAVAAGNTNTYTVAADAGSEMALSKDVTARLGIQKTFATITYLTVGNSTSTTDGATTISGGVGLNPGNLSVDADLSIPLIVQGPSFISGSAGVIPWTAELSVTYYFAAAK